MKKTFFIITTLVLIVIGCENEEPIDLNNPDSYPIKYNLSSFTHGKDYVYVITDDLGNYKETTSDPLKDLEDEDKYFNKTRYLEAGGFQEIVFRNDSIIKLISNGFSNELNYKINNNKIIIPADLMITMKLDEKRHNITQYLGMIAAKNSGGEKTPIIGNLKFRRFQHFNYNNVEHAVKINIKYDKLKKNDTLYITEYWANFKKD